MKGEDLFRGLNYINTAFVEEAETVTQLKEERKLLSLRRPVLIAAIVAMLAMLVGCAVAYVLSMKEMEIGQQQTYRDAFAYDPDTGEAIAYLGQETVTQQVLTLGGIKGSKNYQAAQEWFAFKQEYDPDHAIIMDLQNRKAVPEFPAEYGSYNIYSQEMKDKLDEILEKYDLQLIGRTVPFRTEELTCKALGIGDIVAPGSDAVMELDYAAYQECGNLNMDFNLCIPGDSSNAPQETRCHIYYMHKNAFTEDVISLEEIETWKEWNYTTAAGANVLIVRSPEVGRGYIFCDMPNYTVTLRYEFIDEQYSNSVDGGMIIERSIMTDQQIERLADAIDFSMEPRLMDGWEKLTDQVASSGDAINGFSIALQDVYSDGNNAIITLAVTAPDGVDLLKHQGYAMSLKPSNRWGFFEPVSEGSGNVSGGYRVEEDGDGKANTQNIVLDYSSGSEHIRSGEQPFAEGKVWNIYWQDIYGSYLNEKTNEAEQFLIAEGSWSIDVEFREVNNQELELISEPIPAKAAYGWDMQGNDVYKDTMITSVILRPRNASIVCDLETIAPDFLTVGDRCVYVVMKDGSQAVFHADSAGAGVQNLQTDTPIDLNQVSHLLLPDGTKLTVPYAS